MSLKTLIKSNLRRLGVDVVRYFPDSFLPPIEVLPLYFKAYIGTCLEADPDFFFVQVGASDGMADDPLRESVTTYHLRGLLIEPLPDLFERLRQNYAGEPQLRFENVAVAAVNGRLVLYRPKAGAPVPPVAPTFNRDLLVQQGIDFAYIEGFEVEAATLGTLLGRHGVERVNLLQIDAEGFDYQIVRSAIASGLRPNVINYEHCHLSSADAVACKRLLYDAGYRFIDVGIDTLCQLQHRT